MFTFKDPVNFNNSINTSKRVEGTDPFSRRVVAYDASGFGWIVSPDLSGNITSQPYPTFERDFANYKTLNHGEGPDITFTRGSSATYFDSTGVMRLVNNNEPRFDHGDFRTNLVSWSVFSSAGNARWTNLFPAFATTITGIDAPDGTTTAVRLSSNNQGSALLRVNIPTFTVAASGTPYTLSFWCRLISGSGIPSADLNDGQPSGNYDNQLTANVWRRVSLSGIPLSGTKAWVDVFDNKNTNLVLDYWGVQLETGLSATPYIPTAGSVVTVGESRGLLIEESRTNSIRNAQAGGATNGVIGSGGAMPTNWFVGSASGITREVVGTGTANGLSYVDLKFSGTNSTGSLLPFTIGPEGLTQMVASSGQTWTASIYAALAAGATSGIATLKLDIAEYQAPSTYLANSLGPDISLSATMSRFSHTRTLTNASTDRVAIMLYIQVAIGATIDLTFRIAAPQLEQGAFATGYIPTTTAAATRAADRAVVTPISSFYNQAEGTLFAEASVTSDNFAGRDVVSLNSEVPNEWIGLRWAGNTQAQFAVVADNVTQASVAASGYTTAGAVYKRAGVYKVDDFAQAINGTVVGTDTSGTLPVVNRLVFAAAGNQATLNGHIRKVAYWPKRLSNTFLQQQTS